MIIEFGYHKLIVNFKLYIDIIRKNNKKNIYTNINIIDINILMLEQIITIYGYSKFMFQEAINELNKVAQVDLDLRP